MGSGIKAWPGKALAMEFMSLILFSAVGIVVVARPEGDRDRSSSVSAHVFNVDVGRSNRLTRLQANTALGRSRGRLSILGASRTRSSGNPT